MKKGRVAILLVILLVLSVIFLALFWQNRKSGEVVGWKSFNLVDVESGKNFKIGTFEGKKVLLESFTVWCPTCKRQQDEIKKLHDELGDSIVSISLNTDPNEDVANVEGHLDRYGYDWYFAVAPSAMIRALITEFGISVINAPSAPVILICEDQSARLLGKGVKTAEELKEEINKGC